MPVRSHSVFFELPSSFIDETNYSFKTDDQAELVRVVEEQLPSSSVSLDRLILQRLTTPKTVPLKEVKCDPSVSSNFKGAKAGEITFSYTECGREIRETWVFGKLAPDSFFRIIYKAVAERYSLETLTIILSSAHHHDAPCHGQVPETYKRYQAGHICLAIPVLFRPPHLYSFVCSQGCGRITLSIYDARAKMHPIPSFKQEIDRELLFGMTVQAIQEGVLPIAGAGHANCLRYTTRSGKHRPMNCFGVLRGQITLSTGMTVAVSGSHVLPVPEEFDTAFHSLLSSVSQIEGLMNTA